MLQLTGCSGAAGLWGCPPPARDLKSPRHGPQRSFHCECSARGLGASAPALDFREGGGQEASAAVSEHDSLLSGPQFPHLRSGPVGLTGPAAVTFCVCTFWGEGLSHLPPPSLPSRRPRARCPHAVTPEDAQPRPRTPVRRPLYWSPHSTPSRTVLPGSALRLLARRGPPGHRWLSPPVPLRRRDAAALRDQATQRLASGSLGARGTR